MSDDYHKSFNAGLSGGPPPSGSYNQNAYTSGLFTKAENDRQHREQMARVKQANAKRAASPAAPAPSTADAADFSGLWKVVVFALIVVGFAISVAAAVFAVFAAAALWMLARNSETGPDMGYGSCYVASFFTTAGYGIAIALLFFAWWIYRYVEPSMASTGSILKHPMLWNIWIVLACTQPVALLTGAGFLTWRCGDRYSGFIGYLHALCDTIMLLVIGAAIAAAILIPLDLLIVYFTGRL